jgi:serralysin
VASKTSRQSLDRLAATEFDEAKAAVRAFLGTSDLGTAATAAFGVSASAVQSAVAEFDRKGWPKLVLLDEADMHGARAAYDTARNVIYVSRQFVESSAGDPTALRTVLIEEIGHAIDSRVHNTDAAGDEGAIFAAFVTGDAPGAVELSALQSRNDHGTILVNGKMVAVEFAAPVVGSVTLDGDLSDWRADEQIDRHASIEGYDIYGKTTGDAFVFALSSPVAVGPGTTIWIDADQNAATGFQIFGSAGGAEFLIDFDAQCIPHLYTAMDGVPVSGATVSYGYSADGKVVELSVSADALGDPRAINTLWDVNNSAFLPTNYWGAPYEVVNTIGLPVRTDFTQKVAIVYSETSAANYFSEMAYSQLFMAAQNQAAMAGVQYDLLTEDDLTDIARLVNYDAIIFPSFANVQSGMAADIEYTLKLAVQHYDISLIVAGELMTKDETNAVLGPDPYARMKTLLDLNIVGGTYPNDVSVQAADVTHAMMDDYAAGESIRNYTGVGWLAFDSLSGTEKVLATQTVGGTTYNAVVETVTGGRNVHFSTEAVMADNNLLWQAIDHVVNDGGVSVGLQLSRHSSIVASRVDMDQAMEIFEVRPDDGTPGIYDKLLPVLEQWKLDYNFVGSYYIDIGNDVQQDQYTDWSVSGPYYQRMVALGNEIGSHSLTHPHDTNALAASQIQTEFGTSKQIIETEMSRLLGQAFGVDGAAVPGAPENLATALEIIRYYDYLSGGYSSLGAGYPGAFGYLTPDMAAQDKVYLAPNLKFDFSLVEFQGMTAAEAAAEWQREWSELASHAELPVLLWPWHDYGAADWPTDGGADSPYTVAMFTDFISRAYDSGAEFLTLDDLAERISAFDDSSVSTSQSGNVVTATVSSVNAGRFALDLDHLGTQKIASVAGWYAYDEDSVFLDRDGGTYSITLGTAADDVTRITALPMRAELVTLSGNGTDLSFTLIGEGRMVIDLANPAGREARVTGASIVSQSADILTLDVGGIGRHDVTVRLVDPNRAPVITSNGGGAAAILAVAENGTAVTTVTATDPDASAVLTYAIAGGADQALFRIGTSGALSFAAAPDFEAPADSDRDNSYVVQVRVTDEGGLSDTQTLTVNVTDVFENRAPTITSNGGGANAAIALAENTSAVATVAATDADAGQTISYAIVGGADAARFAINAQTGALSFVTAPDFETPLDAGANNVYDLVVAASDSLGATDTQALSVTVTNVGGRTFTGTSGGNNITGTGEEDLIRGLNGNDFLNGAGGNDRIEGDGGSDILIGGAGNDTIVAGNGGDTLYGDAGSDTLTGGGGSDLFYYAAATEGLDRITDFARGRGNDRLDIGDVIDYAGGSNLGSFVRLTGTSAETTVWVNPDGAGTDFTALATLQGVAMTATLLNEMLSQGNLVVT